MSPPDLSVAVLAYNEEENVGPVLEELMSWLAVNMPDAEVVFIDDGSTDATASEARSALSRWPRASVLRHERNRGLGAGLKTAVRAASGEWMSFLPADGQIAPEALGTLRRAATDETQVVFSVYDHRDDGLHRKVLSWGVRALILGVHGVAMRSDGPYLFRRTLFDPEQLPPDTFFLNFEFPIRVMNASLPCEEVTIKCRPRLAGQSKTANLSRVLGVARDLASLRRRRAHEFVARALGRPSEP